MSTVSKTVQFWSIWSSAVWEVHSVVLLISQSNQIYQGQNASLMQVLCKILGRVI